TVSDVDDTLISGGTITITGNFVAGDVLAVTGNGTITGVYDGDGTLTLTGTDTLANYQAEIRTLTYLITSEDPTSDTNSTTRTLTYSLTGAGSDGVGPATGTVTKTIDITPLTDNPVMSAGGTLEYTENQAAQVIDASVSVVSDADDTQMASATVQLTAGLTAGDVLAVQGTAIGDTVAGTNITVASYDAATGVLTLTGADTLANYQAVLRTVTYHSTSEDPTINATSRTVSWRVTDANSDAAGAGQSVAVTSTINITPLTDKPVITPTVGNATYTENDPATLVDATLTLADVDDTNVQAVNGVTVTITDGWLSSDELAVTDAGTITSSYDAATGVLTLTGAGTMAEYEAVLRTLTYRNTSDDPTNNTNNTTRTLTYSVTDANSDDAGAGTNTATKTIDVTPLTDKPVITPTAGNATYTENDPATLVDDTLTLTDVDDTNVQAVNGVTVTITDG